MKAFEYPTPAYCVDGKRSHFEVCYIDEIVRYDKEPTRAEIIEEYNRREAAMLQLVQDARAAVEAEQSVDVEASDEKPRRSRRSRKPSVEDDAE